MSSCYNAYEYVFLLQVEMSSSISISIHQLICLLIGIDYMPPLSGIDQLRIRIHSSSILIYTVLTCSPFISIDQLFILV